MWGLDAPDRYILQQKVKQVSKGMSLTKKKARCQRSHSTKISMPDQLAEVGRAYIDPSSRFSLCLLRCFLPRVFACTIVSHVDDSLSSSSTALGSLPDVVLTKVLLDQSCGAGVIDHQKLLRLGSAQGNERKVSSPIHPPSLSTPRCCKKKYFSSFLKQRTESFSSLK